MNDYLKFHDFGEGSTTCCYDVVDAPLRTDGHSLADDLPPDVSFDVMAFGGQSTVCSCVLLGGKCSSSYQSEAELGEAFIVQLKKCHADNCRDKTIVADIERAISAS